MECQTGRIQPRWCDEIVSRVPHYSSYQWVCEKVFLERIKASLWGVFTPSLALTHCLGLPVATVMKWAPQKKKLKKYLTSNVHTWVKFKEMEAAQTETEAEPEVEEAENRAAGKCPVCQRQTHMVVNTSPTTWPHLYKSFVLYTTRYWPFQTCVWAKATLGLQSFAPSNLHEIPLSRVSLQTLKANL